MSDVNLNDIEKDLDRTESVSNNYLIGAYIRFGIRWTITIMLYFALWNVFTWICWTLLFSVPFGFYALYRLITTQDRLNDQFKDVREALEEARKLDNNLLGEEE